MIIDKQQITQNWQRLINLLLDSIAFYCWSVPRFVFILLLATFFGKVSVSLVRVSANWSIRACRARARTDQRIIPNCDSYRIRIRIQSETKRVCLWGPIPVCESLTLILLKWQWFVFYFNSQLKWITNSV